MYSDTQIIRIEEDRETYELIFKKEKYNDELLYLYSNDAYIPLDECSKNENETELICKLEKEEIEEALQYNKQIFETYSYYDKENYDQKKLGIYKMEIIENIIIIDERLEKQDIYVKITKLLLYNERIDKNIFVPYETNVTTISNVVTNKFQFLRNNNSYITCYLKRSGNDPLLFLCRWNYEDFNTLGEIKNEIILNITLEFNQLIIKKFLVNIIMVVLLILFILMY